jgi:hypothetical protein
MKNLYRNDLIYKNGRKIYIMIILTFSEVKKLQGKMKNILFLFFVLILNNFILIFARDDNF